MSELPEQPTTDLRQTDRQTVDSIELKYRLELNPLMNRLGFGEWRGDT